MDVVIAGGGFIGLFAGLLLARDGAHVVVLERDGAPADAGSPDDDFAAWSRPGVPQAVHSHALLARSVRELRAGCPDVLDEVMARGATPSGRSFGAGYEDDHDLQSRRLVVEAVMRRAAAREPRLTVEAGAQVAGLVTANGDGARVTGFRTRDGDTYEADLAVDALGRKSATPRWLRELGLGEVAEDHHPFDVHYFARHYRGRGGRLPVERSSLPRLAMAPYGLFIVFGGDGDTYSLAGALSLDDPLARRLRDPDTFDRVMREVSVYEDVVDAGEPITDVHLMGGIANRRRRLTVNGRPLVDGLVLLGDAALYTNATFGQGISLGTWQARALAREVGEANDPATEVAARLEAWSDATLAPLFDAQVASDAAMTDLLRAGIDGSPLPEPPPERRPFVAALRLREQGDPVVAPAMERGRHLLTSTADEFASAPVRERVEEFLATDPDLSPGEGPLPRARFEELVAR